VFVQIGSGKNTTGGSLTRNHESYHNHRAKSLWMHQSPDLQPDSQPGIIVHQRFFPAQVIEQIVQALHAMLIAGQSRLVHLTEPMVALARSMINQHVGKWEKQLSKPGQPVEWLTEVYYISFCNFKHLSKVLEWQAT
jgi:hypothetical protein